MLWWGKKNPKEIKKKKYISDTFRQRSSSFIFLWIKNLIWWLSSFINSVPGEMEFISKISFFSRFPQLANRLSNFWRRLAYLNLFTLSWLILAWGITPSNANIKVFCGWTSWIISFKQLKTCTTMSSNLFFLRSQIHTKNIHLLLFLQNILQHQRLIFHKFANDTI